jgi:asparagine synthase (glutamine-hydrolysing)
MRQMERSIPPAGSIRLTDPELHRQVCQNYLPRRILQRKKRGFAVNVVDEWFRSSMEGEIPELLLDESSLMYDLLKTEPVRKLMKDHRSGRQDNHKLLFSLVMLEQWLRGDRSARKPEYATVSH